MTTNLRIVGGKGVKESEINPKEKGKNFTTFTLFFPTLIIMGIAIYSSTLIMGVIVVALAIYQAALTQRYIESNQI